MKNLAAAMAEEQKYIENRFKNIKSNLLENIKPFGYNTLESYIQDKKTYIFNTWQPEVYYVDVSTLTTTLQNAIKNKQYGIFISTSDNSYAFHGNDEIDYELCEKLNVTPVELYYQGGTIIGGPNDFGIWIFTPTELQFTFYDFITGFYNILSKYISGIVINKNDFLLDNKKIMGSMSRATLNGYIWAAQFSFTDQTQLIEKLCNKKSDKVPGYIENSKLTKEQFKIEVLKWLQKL